MSRLSNKVMLESEFKGFLLFRAACACLHPDHDVRILVSFEENTGVEIEFHKKLSLTVVNEGFPSSLRERLKVIWQRLVACFKILFTGELELESSFLLTEVQHLDDLISALQTGREMVELRRTEIGSGEQKDEVKTRGEVRAL